MGGMGRSHGGRNGARVDQHRLYERRRLQDRAGQAARDGDDDPAAIGSGDRLFPESLETVGEPWASLTLVRQVPDKQRERLHEPGDLQGTGVDWIETDVADQRGRDVFCALVVAAV